MQSTPESGTRAGYDGAKRRKGSKIHAAVDTLGNLLALHASAADQNDRDHVGELCEAVSKITDERVEVVALRGHRVFVDLRGITSGSPRSLSPCIWLSLAH